MGTFFVKKLFLGLVLLVHTVAFGQLHASEPQRINKSSDPQLDQKTIQKCADFLVSKALIRNVHGYLHRSVGPTKRLLQGVFLHCDFHKNQLQDLKEYVSELQLLIDASIPIAARMVFLALPHPQLEQFVYTLGQDDDEAAQQPFFDYMDTIESYLAEQDPQAYAALVVQRIKWEQFNDKWQERMVLLADFVSTRLKVRQEYIEKNVESFRRTMIWKHIGPTLGLGIQAAWTARKLVGCDHGDDILIALIQEMYVRAIDKKDILEKEVVYLARKTTRDYSTMGLKVINHSLARFA